MVPMNLFAGQQWRCRHREQTYMDTGGVGGKVMVGRTERVAMETCTLPIRKTTNGNLLYDSGNSNQGSVIT